jgi:hypothetical protein
MTLLCFYRAKESDNDNDDLSEGEKEMISAAMCVPFFLCSFQCITSTYFLSFPAPLACPPFIMKPKT